MLTSYINVKLIINATNAISLLSCLSPTHCIGHLHWLYMTLLSVEALLLLRQYYLSNIRQGITIRQVNEYLLRHYYLSSAALPSSPTLDHSLTSSRSSSCRWSSRHAPTLVTVAVAVVGKHYYPSCQPCQSSDSISHTL